jgi:hypothetical protein
VRGLNPQRSRPASGTRSAKNARGRVRNTCAMSFRGGNIGGVSAVSPQDAAEQTRMARAVADARVFGRFDGEQAQALLADRGNQVGLRVARVVARSIALSAATAVIAAIFASSAAARTKRPQAVPVGVFHGTASLTVERLRSYGWTGGESDYEYSAFLTAEGHVTLKVTRSKHNFGYEYDYYLSITMVGGLSHFVLGGSNCSVQAPNTLTADVKLASTYGVWISTKHYPNKLILLSHVTAGAQVTCLQQTIRGEENVEEPVVRSVSVEPGTLTTYGTPSFNLRGVPGLLRMPMSSGDTATGAPEDSGTLTLSFPKRRA